MTLLTGNSENTATFAFNQLDDGQFMTVNDGVMGGRSKSEVAFSNGAVNFKGTVSLENNGGFASVRMVWPFESNAEYNESTVVSLQVKGDGLRYQFRLRTNRGFDGAAYSYSFKTTKGQQQTVYIPVDQFIPTFRGRQLRDMPQLRLADVQQMGILVADKQVGDFSIDLIHLALK